MIKIVVSMLILPKIFLKLVKTNSKFKIPLLLSSKINPHLKILIKLIVLKD